LFTKSPETIARELASEKVSPKGPGSGMRMLTYFINRAGKGLSPTRLEPARFRVRAISVEYLPHDQRQNIRCEVRWPSPHGAADLPAIFEELERTPGLIQLAWHTQPGISPEGSETQG
jgi:Protein of unknown function (DUF3175)